MAEETAHVMGNFPPVLGKRGFESAVAGPVPVSDGADSERNALHGQENPTGTALSHHGFQEQQQQQQQ